MVVFLWLNCIANLLTDLLKNESLKNKVSFFCCLSIPTNTLKKCFKKNRFITPKQSIYVLRISFLSIGK